LIGKNNKGENQVLPLPFDHILFPITEFFPAKLQASTRSRFDLRA